ncbi:hypothetical protein QQ045_013340 [Rhodiola kirilowii]
MEYHESSSPAGPSKELTCSEIENWRSTIYSQSLFGSVCCSSKDDQQLQKQFKAMNPSDAGCASVLKSILCTNRQALVKEEVGTSRTAGIRQHTSVKKCNTKIPKAQINK